MALANDPRAVSIVPQLSVRRGHAAIEFYKAAFGAIEVYRVGGTDDNPDVVAQLSVGSASFWVSDESPPNANFSPESVRPRRRRRSRRRRKSAASARR